MERDYSPFTPGQPVSVELFSGRVEQVRSLERLVQKATAGRLAVGFLTGERGIGKSSLAKYLCELAEIKHKALPLHVFLGGVTSLEEMARRVFDRLAKDSQKQPWYDKVKKFLGNHVREIGIFGVSVEFSADQKELRSAVNNFASVLRNLIDQFKQEKDGLLLVLDDINGLSSSPDFANWLKSLVDEIAVGREQLPLCLLLVGLDEKRRELIKSNESLARVFDLVDLPIWSSQECRDFFQKAFESISLEVEGPAMKAVVRFSQGLPMIAHQIGDAVTILDDDGVIDKEDATMGIIQASEVIGRKYFEPKVLATIESKNYLNILKKLVFSEVTPYFTRNQLAELASDNEKKALDNFLNKMKRLGVIESYPGGGKGTYRFTNLVHLLYLKLIVAVPELSKYKL